MANLHKRDDREDWLTWAIEFMRRGLWLDRYITVHGPHDASGAMWGDATAQVDGQEYWPECRFSAVAKRSKYRPAWIRIWADEADMRFQVRKTSELTPKALRWMRAAESTLRKLRNERQAARAAEKALLERLKGGVS
jgi:hypothetical protein